MDFVNKFKRRAGASEGSGCGLHMSEHLSDDDDDDDDDARPRRAFSLHIRMLVTFNYFANNYFVA